MENKIINLQINDNINEAESSVKSLKAQLREAQNEVASLSDKFGATSKEAVEAAKQAAILRDKIGDAKQLTDAFNPDAKFKALSNSLTGVAGGFSAVTGAMGAFGVNSKAVEEELLKVQSAMAMASGLQAVGESIDSFKQLGAVVKSYSVVQKLITAGQWLWNAAMAANPIGVLVAAVTALIASGVALVNYFKSSSEATEQNTRAVETNKRALENQTKTLDKNSSELERKQNHELAMAKASGASASAIRALELKLIDEKIAYEKSAAAVAYNTYEKNKNYLASLKAADADDEVIKKQIEITNASVKEVNKQNENLKRTYEQRKDIQLRHQVEIRQAQTDHQKDVEAKTKEHNQKLKDAAEQAEKERVAKVLESRKKDSESVISDNLSPAAKMSNASLQVISANQITETLMAQDHSKIRMDIAKKEADAKIEQAQRGAALLSNISDLMGKDTAAGKVAAVAATTINTYAAAQAAFLNAQKNPISILGPAYPFIQAGLAIAGGIKNVQAILSVPTPGGSGGGSAPSATSMGTAAPSFNVVGQGGANQIAQSINNQEQQPVQAYVVAGAVTTSQALNRNIINNASMG